MTEPAAVDLPRASRVAGSIDEFEREWQRALELREDRWFVFPDRSGHDQISLAEWVKAEQIVSLLRHCGLDGARLVEYGCGAAGISIYLRERGFRVIAADIAVGALEVARINDSRHRRRASTDLPLLRADTLDLPFADRALDGAMSFGLLEHFDDQSLDALMREVCRVIRPGGLFLADIIPARFNARAVGNAINAAAAMARPALRGDVNGARSACRAYFGHYFETGRGPDEWAEILGRHGLRDVRIRVCRPFPPLALSGSAGRAYTDTQRALLPFWRRFDSADTALTRRWGWMYLVSGIRSA